MRITQICFRQPIGWHFQQLWKYQSKRRILRTKAHKVLAERNITVTEPEEILYPKKPHEKFDVIGMYEKPIQYDETHPLWKSRTCLTYKDDNVLLEGLNQAKVLTNTVQVQENLPEKLAFKEVDKNFDSLVKHAIFSSNVFDAEQKKLPKIKDPLRPSFNFPRVYGITEQRVNKLIISKLLHLIETHADGNIVKERHLSDDLLFSFPFEKYGELIQFQLTTDTLMTSSQPLSPVCVADTEKYDLPDIYPIKATITLNPQNIYELRTVYPISDSVTKSHPHTLFIHYNRTEVKNIYEEEVTENQIFGRSLLKAFTVSATYARQRYGEDVKNLPKPVTVQCVQTDGRLFHFGLFQLNTLNLDGTDVKNIWFQTNSLPLFDHCKYIEGRPQLQNYNNDVVKHLFAFYNNT